MDYQTLKRNIIETARRDPFGFLYAKLMKKGVYYGHASAPSLDYGLTVLGLRAAILVICLPAIACLLLSFSIHV